MNGVGAPNMGCMLWQAKVQEINCYLSFSFFYVVGFGFFILDLKRLK